MPFKNTVIFGNSGSGKSTLAKKLVEQHGSAHLDLDTLAWLPTSPPTRQDLEVSVKQIEEFIAKHSHWVIEGCYADLLEAAASSAEQMIFMNLPVASCIENAKARPWEPHKYVSKEAQDENLQMLLDWIEQYPIRTDEFSQRAHQGLFERFNGKKAEYTQNV